MKSTFPSRQTESANPQNQNPATQNAEEASTSAATSTSTSESRCPPFISFTDKMIVAAGMKRLWEFSDVKTYMNATYILRWDAQKHPEGLRIWKEEFMNATWDTYLRSRALLVYHNLFSQEAWKEVYKYVMNEFPELREVQGETDKETRQNLRLWDDEFDKRGKKERTPEEEEQLKAWNEAEMMEWEKLMEETKLKEKKALGEQDPHLDLE